MLWLQCDASYNQTHDTWHTTVAGAGLTMELFNVKFREYHHRWHWLIAGLRTTGLDNVFYLTCISNNEDKSVTRTADIVSHTCVLSLMLNTLLWKGFVSVCVHDPNIYITNCDVVKKISTLWNGFNKSHRSPNRQNLFGSVGSSRSHNLCPSVCLLEPKILCLVI